MELYANSSELNQSVEAFFAYLRRRGKAPRTVKRWSAKLDRFVAWAGDRELHEISSGDLELGFLAGWEADFRDRNGRAPALNSTRAVIQALRSFYAFLERFDQLVDGNGGFPRCKVCQSEHRDEIDTALRRGDSQASVRRHFNGVLGREYFTANNLGVSSPKS